VARIFISYRRDDDPSAAGRLYDALSASFGADGVFMDTDTLEPGASVSMFEHPKPQGTVVTIRRRTGADTTATWISVIPAEGQGQQIVDAVNGYVGAVRRPSW
jgi:hypothetical protein